MLSATARLASPGEALEKQFAKRPQSRYGIAELMQ